MNCIVVPIYKDFEKLSNGELISLSQLFKVFGNHKIFFIGPQNFNWSNFLIHAEKRNVFPKAIEFDLYYFESINGYNQLMISLEFFKNFKGYDFMLIYQLDAYVFKDELEYWCSKGYDYIGAPWFEGWNLPMSNNIIGIGNGGFSLRNIESSIRILTRIILLQKLRRFWFKSRLQAIWRFHKMLLLFRRYFRIRSMKEINVLIFLNHSIQEDSYWTNIVGGAFTDYKVAEIEDAFKFSFEVNPSFLYKKNNNQLPFGCHAWEKYEPEFWKEFINPENKLQLRND
jgi:hypothetical protein